MNVTQLWQNYLLVLSKEMPEQQIKTWLMPLIPAEEAGIFILYAPNNFVLRFVKERYLSRIQALFSADYPLVSLIELKVGVNKNHGQQTAKTTAKSIAEPLIQQTSKATPPKEIDKEEAVARILSNREGTRLQSNHTFETLVTGKSNELASVIAQHVAANLGDKAHNPFFIYGGVGLGKTHILQAIGNHAFKQNSRLNIRYIHAEQYVRDLMKAAQHRTFDDFKRFYHSIDLLLLDDIQFIGGKDRTQEEFFYLFNTLFENGKQIVMTSDTFPRHLEKMEERLISRFSYGISIEIEPPEPEMRVAILLKKASAEGLSLDQDIAFFIAQNIRANVRELEGALKKVVAHSRFLHQPITLALAKEALKDLLAANNRQISLDEIQKTVADFYHVKLAEILGKKRNRDIARPRQIAMALSKELTTLSLPSIGAAFGGRDHTTVIHACKTVVKLRAEDSELDRAYLALSHMLQN